MQNTDLATVSIFRFDPDIDKKPHYDKYEVPYKGNSILGVLDYIYQNLDSSLSYRSGCTHVWCGVCNLVVNGRVVLGCRKSAEKEMVIEPHPKFHVIKDLVVDFEHKEKKRKELPPTPVQFTVRPDLCDGCGDCVLICPTGATGLRKKGNGLIAVHTDPQACCGISCRLCADNCHTMAITIKE